MPKWFRFRRVGLGLTPISPMGWILTAALILIVMFLAHYFKKAHTPLPVMFYVWSGGVAVVYTIIALATVDRGQ